MNKEIVHKFGEEMQKVKERKDREYHEKLQAINSNITFEEALRIREVGKSFKNKLINISGKTFESVFSEILDAHKINYEKQVSINVSKRVFQYKKKAPMVDFVVYPMKYDNVYDAPLSECIIIILRQQHEKYVEDMSIIDSKPLKFILVSLADDMQSHARGEYYYINLSDESMDIRDLIDIQFARHRVITYADLCCGIGSFHYAMQEVCKNCSRNVIAADIMETARNVYKKNYGICCHGDITGEKFMKKLRETPCDVLFCGTPCQDFSQIGKHVQGNVIEHLLDNVFPTRLFPVVVMETLIGLLGYENGNTIKYIYESIKESGYRVFSLILLCSCYGIPQKCTRVFILCLLDNEDIDDDEVNEMIKEICNKHKKKTTLTEYLGNGQEFLRDTAHTVRHNYARAVMNSKQNWDGYYVKNRESGEFDMEYRLTFEDILKLQGFPSDFKLLGSRKNMYTLLGNTTPTNLSKIVAEIVARICEMYY